MSPEQPKSEVTASGEGVTATASIGESATVHIFQFVGLLWVTEYNARQAALLNGLDSQTVNGINTILSAYAALEALVTETAFCLAPGLYGQRNQFRRKGLADKFSLLLSTQDRSAESLPDVIDEVSAHRIALTHSEPDNSRSSQIGTVISATDAERFAKEVRNVANWLWQESRPNPVAASFDAPNVFIAGMQAHIAPPPD